MTRRSRQRKATGGAKRGRWRSRLSIRLNRIWLRRVLWIVLLLAAWIGTTHGLSRLEAHVDEKLLGRFDQPRLTFLDLPDSVAELVRADLYAAVEDSLKRPWTEDALCREMATRLATVGWVAKVHYVRRTADARFEISARYRIPVALVQREKEFFLVDDEPVRLPGLYRYEPSWLLIHGVAQPPPQPGVTWSGEDLRAGLAILQALRGEPYRDQVTAIVVDNFGGRRNPRQSHLELATDRAGGRIRWGSAPEREVEENSVVQKLTILRANYQQSGRADAGHQVIDVATFPDRYIIPG